MLMKIEQISDLINFCFYKKYFQIKILNFFLHFPFKLNHLFYNFAAATLLQFVWLYRSYMNWDT